MTTTEQTTHTFTVSLMAEAEVNAGTDDHAFEDVILGTYKDKRAAMAAARKHVKANPEAQAQVFDCLPHDPKFTSWSSLKAMVYVNDDAFEGPVGLIVENFR